MRVKMILPALTEATSPFFRPIKYSLFPPLGLATLAGYLRDDDQVSINDEHVEPLKLDDQPDLVVIQVYITSARRSYQIADHYRRRGGHVVLGGLHVTSLPDEAAQHADTLLLGPGEDTFPRFVEDLRAGGPQTRYVSQQRTLLELPPIRRDLIHRHRYLVPNSIVVSRGCPHVCDFCYKVAFFKGGKQFYTQTVDAALSEIDRLPGRHLYFLDDHLFGNPRFAASLFDGMAGMGRLWQAAGTVKSVLERPGCAACSSASRPSTPPISASSASTRTSDATTTRRSAAFMTWESWSTAASSSAWTATPRTCSTVPSAGPSARASKQPPSTSSRRTRTPPCTTGWPPSTASCTATGTGTTPATSCSGPRAWTPRRWNRATGAPTRTSTDGDRSGPAPAPRTPSGTECGTWPTPADG